MTLSRPSLAMLLFAAVNGFIVINLESYTAHGLEEVAGEYAVHIFHMSAKYQMWHALALAFLGLIHDRLPMGWPRRLNGVAAVLFAGGMLSFCAGMYAVPFGGPLEPAIAGAIIFMAGWASFAAALVAATRRLRKAESGRREQQT